ncbi:MAG: NYN domain-containing protein [Prevotellaceae bacterium]|jgi:hypothetical protein|nr:NYN domain-containing protein [Prevotellaceae bacterium]
MQEIKKIAVLVDGDNAESRLIEQILGEAGKYGKVTIKRIYGDWSKTTMKSWIDKLNTFAIRPIQKFAYTTGKNSTDTELIIDAMDILRSHLVDGFCIVSSDSDYTGLANRIREEGLFIMGIGRGHTPEAFVKACETFVFTEILVPTETKETAPKKKDDSLPDHIETVAPKLPGVKIVGQIDLDLIGSLKKSGIKPINQQEIDNAFNMAVNEATGLAVFSRFNESLRQTDPTFSHKNYGYSTFRKFCESLSPAYSIILHEDGVTMSLKKNE